MHNVVSHTHSGWTQIWFAVSLHFNLLQTHSGHVLQAGLQEDQQGGAGNNSAGGIHETRQCHVRSGHVLVFTLRAIHEVLHCHLRRPCTPSCAPFTIAARNLHIL